MVKQIQLMKQVIRFTFIIYISLVCLSCHQKQEQLDIPTVFIDIPINKHSVDSLLSKVELIRLDTINGGIINFISSIEYMNNTIYIKQMSTDEVFSYNSSGKFNFKISSKGGASDEYSNVGDFITNPFNNTLLILDHSDYHQYDTLGNHINYTKITPKSDGRLSTITPYSLDKYICVLDLKWSTSYEIFLVNDKSTTYIFSDTLPINVDCPFYLFNNQLYHYKWYDNTVYKVEEDAFLTPCYKLDFTDDVDVYIPNTITNEDEFEDLIIKKGVCFDQIQENDRYILMGIVQTINNESKRETLIYDKVREQTFNIDNFEEVITVGSRLILTEDNYLIGVVNSEDLKSLIDVELLDTESQNIYNNITDNDNPVIVKSKLRY